MNNLDKFKSHIKKHDRPNVFSSVSIQADQMDFIKKHGLSVSKIIRVFVQELMEKEANTNEKSQED